MNQITSHTPQKFLEDTYAQRAKNIKALLSLKKKGELNE